MHSALCQLVDTENVDVIKKYMLEPLATRASNLDVNRQEGEAIHGCDVKKVMLNYFEIIYLMVLCLQP